MGKAETAKKHQAAAAKRQKKAKQTGTFKAPVAYIDTVLEAEAEKLGMVGSFRRLVERDDLKKFSQRVLLDALVANQGLMHKAKDAVLAGDVQTWAPSRQMQSADA